MADDSPPPDLDGFSYVSEIGSGGFAKVHLYEQHLPRRKVAIKVLRDSTNEAMRSQFTTEANIMAQLSGHPAIVSIYQFGVSPAGLPFLVMEYCPAPNLAMRMRSRPLDVGEALDIMIRICGAAETAHRAGILHRDIKPQNILTNAYGSPLLTDFGIATSSGRSAGEGVSVPWSAPEVLAGGPGDDPRSDVYSLAATLHGLLTGLAPFEVAGEPFDEDVQSQRIQHEPLTSITRNDVPASLNTVLGYAMAKPPGSRYATAMAFAQALHRIQSELRLPQTKIQVLDASPAAVPVDDTRHATHIRPVELVAPTPQASAATQVRAPGSWQATPAAATPPVQSTPPAQSAPARPAAQPTYYAQPSYVAPSSYQGAPNIRRSRRTGRWIGVAALVVIVALSAVAAFVWLTPSSTSMAAPTDVPTAVPYEDAPEDVLLIDTDPANTGWLDLPTPDNFEYTSYSNGIVFTWTTDNTRSGDEYYVAASPNSDDLSLPTLVTSEQTAFVPVDPGNEICIGVTLVRKDADSTPGVTCAVND